MSLCRRLRAAPLLALGLLATSLFALAMRPRDRRETCTHIQDVIYGRKFGMALTLDVFAPTENSNQAAVVFVVSSGWTSDQKMVQSHLASEFLRRGYTVFAVLHSSQPRFDIPSSIADVNRAVRFIRAHAADYQIDPLRIGVAGHSAGGHLALMLATAGDSGDAKAADPIERVSSRVQAAGCLYPPTDFLNYGKPGEIALGSGRFEAFPGPFDFDVLDANGKRFVRVADEAKREELGRQISPAYHVTPDDPPTLIVHGDADELVPIQQAELFIGRLKDAGVPAKLIVKAGAAHGGLPYADGAAVIADWFDKHLARAAESDAPGKKR